jgi:very-short-patch-repair endonuclease
MGRWLERSDSRRGHLMRPGKPARTVESAKRLRREMSLPEVLLWRFLRRSPNDTRFRKQNAAGDFIVDFFCAWANLAIEIDGKSHDAGDRPQRDMERDEWLREHRIDTLRIPASEVRADPALVAEGILGVVEERLARFGKAPPSSLRVATSPSQVDGEDLRQ